MASRSRSYRTHVVILRRRDYSDADRILTVYTPQLGKQDLIAKGARKTMSRKAGHLELFTHASLQLAEARTWPIVTEAETVESFRHIRTDLEQIGRSAYVCELIEAFSEAGDESLPLWDLLLLCLRELDAGVVDPEILLRWFELHLLSVSGFQPQFFQCLGCGDDLQPVINYLNLGAGGVYCPRCGEGLGGGEAIEPELFKVLRHLQRSSWGEVRQLELQPETIQAVELVLQRYLVLLLERQLKSIHIVRRLKSLPRPAAPSSSPAELPTDPSVSHAHP